MSAVRYCAIVPTFDNPATIRRVVEGIREHVESVIVVDDGSGEAGRVACEELEVAGLARVIHHRENRGKGAAVRTGFEAARVSGFTHAVQVDGDGQHDLGRIPEFVALSEANPNALVLGYPVYDDTLHRGRYLARLVTRFWNFVEVLGPTIRDSMCGFRVYPIDAALASGTRGERMDFDIEIPVRMVWNGIRIVNAPVGVRYLSREEGGVSHYRTFFDTARISLLHARLVIEGIVQLVMWPIRRLARRARAR